MVALNEKLHHNGTTARGNRCRAGRYEESGKSVDHVPTLAARPLFTSATSL